MKFENLSEKKKECGNRIRKERLAHNMTLEELRSHIQTVDNGSSHECISYPTMQRIEKGKTSKMPELYYIKQIAELFQIREAYLLCEDDDRTELEHFYNTDSYTKEQKRLRDNINLPKPFEQFFPVPQYSITRKDKDDWIIADDLNSDNEYHFTDQQIYDFGDYAYSIMESLRKTLLSKAYKITSLEEVNISE